MIEAGFSLLLCTNGCDTTRPGLEYGVWLGEVLNAPVVVLGIIEVDGQQKAVEALVEETSRKLEAAGLSYQVLIERGRGPAVIARQASQGNYMAVFGPFGRPAWKRVFQGRSFRRVLEKVETPILYVRQERLQLRRVMVCLGGLGYADSVENLSLYLARATGASVTLLHIVEPINLDYPLAKEVQEHWEKILETATPQGRNLRRAYEEAQKSGLEVDFRVRHGNIVHEILDEARSGDYDLVGMGSAYSAHSLRHLYLPNVTAEVAEALECPILTVRQGHELVE